SVAVQHRHVSAEHDDLTTQFTEGGHRAPHGVPGPVRIIGLSDDLHLRCDLTEMCLDLVPHGSDHGNHSLGTYGFARADRVAHQRSTSHGVQQFGGGRPHPGACACGE